MDFTSFSNTSLGAMGTKVPAPFSMPCPVPGVSEKTSEKVFMGLPGRNEHSFLSLGT